LNGFGFQDDIHIGNRIFKVHSGFHSEAEIGISEVFEEGNFLFRESNKYPIRAKEKSALNLEFVKKKTKKLHTDVINDLQMLYKVHNRLKMVNQPQPYFKLGKVFYVKNIIDEAIENLENAIRLKPEMEKASKILGLAYIKKEKYTKAAEVFRAALKINPDYPDLLNGLGVAYTKLEKYETAKNFFLVSLKIKPDFHEAHFNLGLLLFLSSLRETGENGAVVIPSRIPRSLIKIRENELYDDPFWQKQFDQITKTMKKENFVEIKQPLLEFQNTLAVRENLNITMDMFFLKFMYGGKELQRDELDYYEIMMKNDEEMQGKFADYWNEMGVIHLVQCREYFKKALINFDKAIKINPKYDEAIKAKDLMSRGEKGLLILLRAILR